MRESAGFLGNAKSGICWQLNFLGKNFKIDGDSRDVLRNSVYFIRLLDF